MKISVVIPLYNKRDTILRAINSVLSQSFQPLEIIVVNDGSEDGSERLVEELSNPLVRLINQSNSGVSAARNRGTAGARGEWVAFLDADDLWLPQYLLSVKDLSTNYPDCNVLGTRYYLQSQSGIRTECMVKTSDLPSEIPDYFKLARKYDTPFCSSSVVVRTDVLVKAGGFPSGVTSGEDLLTWARLATQYRIAYNPEPLAVFYQDAAHTYDRKPNRIPQLPDLVGTELKSLALKYRNIPGLKAYVGHWHKMRASIYLRLGMKRKTLGEIFRAMSFNFLNGKLFIYLALLPMPAPVINSVFKKFGKK